MQLDKRLRELRIKRGLTQTELADNLDLTTATISSYEKGIRLPSLKVAILISEFFDISLDYIIGEPNKSNQEINVQGLTTKQMEALSIIINDMKKANKK